MAKSEILLEAGTNELEILVLGLGPTTYGVNVAKVREVIRPVQPTKIPECPKAIRGVFNLRGKVVPLVCLRTYFGLPAAEKQDDQRVIVMEFCDILAGFLVDRIDKIYRMSWKQLAPVPDEAGMHSASLTSIALLDGHIVLIIDFERIMYELGGTVYKTGVSDIGGGLNRADYRLLFAEDSPIMRTECEKLLRQAGYTNLVSAGNGADAWDLLEADAESGRGFDLILSDIEMPQMDGLHLCKKVKADPRFKKTPFVLFSSLISPDNLKKCKSVGADAQISKPQMNKVVEATDELIRTLARNADRARQPAAVA